MSRAGPSVRRTARGLSLIELIAVIVLLGILAVGFMSMYADLTRHNAVNSQIAPMTWLGEGAMSTELLQTELGLAPSASGPTTVGPYTVNVTVSQTNTSVQAGTYYAYLITVTVTCVSGACSPMRFKAHAYTL